MNTIVYDKFQPEDNTRTVRISEHYEDYGIRTLYAILNDYFVQIMLMTDDRKPRSFRLFSEEMDTLCAQWMQFRKDCITAQEAEEKRLEQAREQAYALAKDTPIRIEEYSSNDWRVYLSQPFMDKHATSIDQLLRLVQEAHTSYGAHRATVNKAFALAKKHEIIIKQREYSNSTAHTWTIYDSQANYTQSAETASELLDAIEKVIEATRISQID